MISTKRVQQSYDLVAGKYAAERDQTSSIPFLRKLNSGLAEKSLILDIGCGMGLPIDRWLVDQGHDVIGLDISAAMLELARENVPEGEFKLGDFATLQPSQFSVDAIVCFFALFHVDRVLHQQILETFRTFLNRSGLLLLTTGKTAWEGTEDFLGSKISWSHFDGSTYRGLLEKSGFEIVIEDEHQGNNSIDDDGHPIFLARAI